jgi:hypothetical protein
VTVTDEMIENGCRGMYGKHWDGPPERMSGEKMKDVWRKLSRQCLEAALSQWQGQREAS